MRCIFCYNNSVLFCNPKTQVRKGLIIHNITKGIITLIKNVNVNHSIIANLFEKLNSPLKGKVEKQPTKKNLNPSCKVIVNFFVTKDPFQKDHM
jgi:hypothetical protein